MDVSKSEFFSNRLFLPLKSDALQWYQIGKSIELRQRKGRFKNIFSFDSKYAELRKGYNGESLYCKINEIKEFHSLSNLLNAYDFKSIFPSCTSKQEVLIKYTDFYEDDDHIIAISLKFISVI